MKLDNATVFITGANRGLGLAFAREALARGARKVYAAARDPASVTLPGVVTIKLDVTKPEDIAAAARACGDITLLINNAGINRLDRAILSRDDSAARAEMEVNYFGTLGMCRAFAPALIANRGAVVNMLSILARVGLPMMGSLCASKAAALRMTECLRAELAEHHVRVLGVLPGAIDTDMSRDFPPPKLSVTEVVDAVFAALANGPDEVYVGAMAQGVSAGLAADRDAVQKQFAGYL